MFSPLFQFNLCFTSLTRSNVAENHVAFSLEYQTIMSLLLLCTGVESQTLNFHLFLYLTHTTFSFFKVFKKHGVDAILLNNRHVYDKLLGVVRIYSLGKLK